MRYIVLTLSFLLLLIAPFFGQIELNLSNINELGTVDYKLFWDLRLPRILVAFFTGALLGLSGLLFQSIFRNPMSTPFTLGVASGATLGTAFAIVFGFIYYIAFFGFGGALMTIVILFTLSSKLKSYENPSLTYLSSLKYLFLVFHKGQLYLVELLLSPQVLDFHKVCYF